MTRLARFLRVLVYALPAVLFFSYYPIISLGANSTMNFELSLPLIWLALFDLASLIALIILSKNTPLPKSATARAHARRWGPNFPGITDRRIFLLTLFPFFATLSAFWSANPLRGLLTAAVLWAVWFTVFSLLYIMPMLDKNAKVCYNGSNPSSRGVAALSRRTLLRVFFISAAIVCIFCFLQSILDLCGLSRGTTLLCAGCTYRSFGFPHPSGFAIEPQFMGNLLLAPTLTALYLLLRTGNDSRPWLLLAATLFSTTLFFTFSRGAIYSYAVALFILFLFSLKRHFFKPTLVLLPLATFAFSLVLQGTFAALGPTSETFTSAVTKSIHQLSLGLIDLRQPTPEPTEPAATPSEDPYFDGYVPESTNYRLLLNEVALDTWRSSPATILFGSGLGSAGTVMNRHAPASIPTPKEIVQNQPISLLLELGLTGILLLLFTFYLLFFRSPFLTHPALPLLLALLAAYFVSLQFFSGLPNALHIYLLPPLLYYFLKKPLAISAP